MLPIVPAAEPRIRINKIRVTSIDIVPVTGEHEDCPFYLDKSHTLEINLKNTGDVYLEDLNVSYQIYKQGGIVELEGYKVTSIDLTPGATTDDTGGPITFTWNPSEINNWYVINVTIIKASVFGDMKFISISETGLNVTIKEIKNKVEPVDYGLFQFRAAEHNGAWPYTNTNVTVTVKNLGNVNFNTDFNVEATIYNTTGAQKWTDNKTGNGLNAGTELSVILKSWKPDADGLWTIKMQTNVSGIFTNLSMPLLIQNVTDGNVVKILNYKNGTTYANESIEAKVMVKNSGNKKILVDYKAKLEIREKISNALMFQEILTIPKIVGNNIITPGNSAQVNFSAWNASNGIKEGDYWLNVTLENAKEVNGTSINNMTFIMIHIENTTSLEVAITQPETDGRYPHNSTYRTVKAVVTNTGTQPANGYNLTLSIVDDNSGMEIFNDQINRSSVLGAGSSSSHTFATWPDVYNGNFTYTVSVKFTTKTVIEHSVERKIVFAGGPDWGNVTGMVTSNSVGLKDVMVGVLEDGMLIEFDETDANGNYKVTNIPADTTPGTIYNVSAYKYGYPEKWNNNVAVINGKETTGIDFELGGLLPMGNITGTVTIIEGGMKNPSLNYTTVQISVEGTPLSVNPDVAGNFVINSVVAGKVNVSATKNNFQPDWDDNVQVIAGQNVSVDLTLVEDWAIEVIPAHQAVDVPINTKIKVTFETDINRTTVNSTTFIVTDKDSNLMGDASDSAQLVWASNNKSFEFKPAGGLAYGENYLIKLTTGVKTPVGAKAVHRNWKSTFTTEIITAPVSGFVVDDESGDPISGANVKVGSTTTQTGSDGSYTLNVQVPALNVSVVASAPYYKTGSLKENDFAEGVVYRNFNISLKRDIKITVKVEINDDNTVVNHLVTLKNVDTDTLILVVFGEPIELSTLTLTLKTAAGTVVNGNSTYDDATTTLTFDPLEELDTETTYKLAITDSLENETGVKILSWDVTWTFETLETLKYWSALEYAPKGAEVALSDPVTVTFNEPMNTSSVESAFSISPLVAGGTFAWNANGTKFTWTHDGFDAGETYTVQILYTATTQLDEIGMLNHTWTFSTVKPPSSFKIGPITDKDGKPMDYAEVTITDENGDIVYGGKTDAEGYITFTSDEGLEPGNYTVKVSKYGYQPETFNFEVDDDGTIIPGYDMPEMKKSESKEEEPIWAYLVMIILIVLIIVFLIMALMPKKRAEEELIEEEAEEEEEEELEEEFDEEDEEDLDEEDEELDEEIDEQEQEELEDFETEEEPFEEEDEALEEELDEKAFEEEELEEEELPSEEVDEAELPEEEAELPDEEAELTEDEAESTKDEPEKTASDEDEEEWE